MSVNLISKDSLTEIINFTSPSKQENANYCLVSTSWKDAADREVVWCHIVDREGIKVAGKTDATSKEILFSIHARKISSNDEIVVRFQEFLDRCSIDKNCRFRCILGSGNRYQALSVEIGSYVELYCRFPAANRGPRKIDMREEYFCMSNSLGNGDLLHFNPPSFPVPTTIWTRLRSSGLSFDEPDYSNPAQPQTTTSLTTHLLSGDRAIVIIQPKINPLGNTDTPLFRQIETMAISKLSNHSKKTLAKSLVIGAVVSYAGVCLVSQLWNYYSAPNNGQP